MLRPLHSRRPAFTLIELMVVIAIIAILASLLIGGVMVVRMKGYDAKDVNDIQQLAIALNKFKAKHGCYPPSKIVLYSKYDDYFSKMNDPDLEDDSFKFLNKIWPNLGGPKTPTIPLPPFATYLNWASTTNAAGFPPNGVILESDQCLVYFLGGVYDPGSNGCIGFSTNPKNPAQDNATGERTKFFDFPARGLNFSKNAVFPSYMDNYDQMPVLYFAPCLSNSKKFPNIYNFNHAVTITYPDATTDLVSPYFKKIGAKTTYWNASTFQIITAGADGRFGDLGEWNNGTSPSLTRTWKDNRANWSSFVLGAEAQ